MLARTESEHPPACAQAQAGAPAHAREREGAGQGGADAAARPLTRAQRAARRQDGASEEPLFFMAVRPLWSRFLIHMCNNSDHRRTCVCPASHCEGARRRWMALVLYCFSQLYSSYGCICTPMRTHQEIHILCCVRQTSSESPSSEGGSRFESDWESADGGDDDADLGFMEAEAAVHPRAARGADGIGRRLRSRRRRAGPYGCGPNS